ncbi:Myb domain, plant [Sesbania bispinosa]|nr:Myb domain, plant [Sesbania bispinosa]
MSADKRKCVRSSSLKNGAALYILKPFCGDDFKDIWKYAAAARKGKLVIENELRSREGAVPKKILEIMNVPYLTRENVANHLQQYLKRLSYQAGNRTITSTLNPFNYGPMSLSDQQVSSNNYVTTQLGTGQFPYPLHNGLMLQNQHGSSLKVRLGQSSFGSHNIGTNNIIGQSSYAKPPYQANSSYNSGAIFPPYGGGHGLMTSANGLIGGYQNYGSMGNHNFSYDPGNWNMGNLSSSNVLPQTSTYYNSGIQQNDGSQMVGTGIKGGINNVGTTNNNSFDFNNVNTAYNNSFGFNNVGNANNGFGFINGKQNANMNVSSLGNGDVGLVQGQFAFPSSASNVGDVCASELPPPALITDGTLEENVSGLPPLPQQLDDIVVENEHQNNNVTSISESEASQLNYDLSDIDGSS